MRLPRMRMGAQPPATAPAAYAGRAAPRVAPMATLACLSNCAGPNAYQCLSCEADDMACWVRCTGANSACLRDCFAS